MAYWRMRRITEQYKKAAGVPYKPVPDELIQLEEEVKKRRQEIERLRAEKAPDVVISQKLSELATVEYAYRQAIKKWTELESELPASP